MHVGSVLLVAATRRCASRVVTPVLRSINSAVFDGEIALIGSDGMNTVALLQDSNPTLFKRPTERPPDAIEKQLADLAWPRWCDGRASCRATRRPTARGEFHLRAVCCASSDVPPGCASSFVRSVACLGSAASVARSGLVSATWIVWGIQRLSAVTAATTSTSTTPTRDSSPGMQVCRKGVAVVATAISSRGSWTW